MDLCLKEALKKKKEKEKNSQEAERVRGDG